MIQISELEKIDENERKPTSLEKEEEIAEKLSESLEKENIEGQIMVCETKRDISPYLDCEVTIR